MLYNKGSISTKKLWDEYCRDQSSKLNSKGEPIAALIPSKQFLKERVLHNMLA